MLIDKAGCVNIDIPITRVKIPKAKVQPQLSSPFLFAIEKMISESPPNINESENSIDSVINELSGEVKTTMLIIIKSKPTNTGTYQCLIEFLIECKNVDFMFFLKCF